DTAQACLEEVPETDIDDVEKAAEDNFIHLPLLDTRLAVPFDEWRDDSCQSRCTYCSNEHIGQATEGEESDQAHTFRLESAPHKQGQWGEQEVVAEDIEDQTPSKRVSAVGSN